MSQIGPDSDSSLVSRLKKGDKGAFEVIFHEYSPKLYFFSLSYLHIEAEAEEVVQNVFVSLWEHRCALDETRSLKSYLYKATVNHIYNYFRHEAIRRKHLEHVLRQGLAGDNSSEKKLDMDELTTSLESLVERLPQMQRKIFKMSRWEGLSHGDIAQQLGLSVRSVENHIYRSLKFFKENLKEEYFI